MSDRVVDIDLRPDGEYIVQSCSLSNQGLWIGEPTPTRLPVGATAEQIGIAAIAALLRSQEEVSSADPGGVNFLRSVGSPSFAQYMRGVKEVSLFSENDFADVTVSPQNNGGWGEGFTTITEHRFTVPGTDPKTLGEAILRSLELATN